MLAMIAPVCPLLTPSTAPIVKSGPIPSERWFQVEAWLDYHAKILEFPLQLLMGGNGVNVYLCIPVEHLLLVRKGDSSLIRHGRSVPCE